MNNTSGRAKETTAQRLKKAMAIRNLRQTDLVEKTGIPKSALSQYISGKFLPKQNRLSTLAEALNVSETWLIGYDVPMEREASAYVLISIPYRGLCLFRIQADEPCLLSVQ